MEGSLLKLVPQRSARCFVEDDASAPLVRRSFAEAVGTMLLIVAVLGAGIGGKAAPISSAMAISGTLIGLILALGSVSGGHFNPVITVLQWGAGQRGLECTTWYVAAQILGGTAGAVLVDLMFAVPPSPPTEELPNAAAVVSEALSTFGLMMVVFCSRRSTNKMTGPFAVGLWLLGAIIATPTGSIANPAVAISLLLSPSSASVTAVALFIAVQFAGGALALQCVDLLYPSAGH